MQKQELYRQEQLVYHRCRVRKLAVLPKRRDLNCRC
jgi:hypothetical protein